MASYHLAVKPISRSGGRSVVASAAYRSAQRLENPRDGVVHDYSRRHDVEFSQIVGWEGSRQALWGRTEEVETRKNARLAVEVEINLPRELSGEQRNALVMAFAQELAAEYRAPVDASVHCHAAKDGGEHPHAHLLVGCRVSENGELGARVVPFDGPEQVERWRGRWAEMQNAALQDIGAEARVDHRTLAEQHAEAAERVELAREGGAAPEVVATLQERADALDREPQVHMTRAEMQAESQGIATHGGDLNREIVRGNAERKGLLDQLRETRLAQDLERVAARVAERAQQAASAVGSWVTERAGAVAERAAEAYRLMKLGQASQTQASQTQGPQAPAQEAIQEQGRGTERTRAPSRPQTAQEAAEAYRAMKQRQRDAQALGGGPEAGGQAREGQKQDGPAREGPELKRQGPEIELD